jgi:topoisomerase-4 subunit B
VKIFLLERLILNGDLGKVEWAIGFVESDGFLHSYCNTIPTPQGGTHEQGLKAAILKSIRNYGEISGNKKITSIIIDDMLQSMRIIISVFIKDPIFQGQTKEKLVSNNVAKLVESNIKDHLDHWLTDNKIVADKLIEYFLYAAEERLNRKASKSVNRKNVIQKLRLPGKLADCSSSNRDGTEIYKLKVIPLVAQQNKRVAVKPKLYYPFEAKSSMLQIVRMIRY